MKTMKNTTAAAKAFTNAPELTAGASVYIQMGSLMIGCTIVSRTNSRMVLADRKDGEQLKAAWSAKLGRFRHDGYSVREGHVDNRDTWMD